MPAKRKTRAATVDAALAQRDEWDFSDIPSELAPSAWEWESSRELVMHLLGTIPEQYNGRRLSIKPGPVREPWFAFRISGWPQAPFAVAWKAMPAAEQRKASKEATRKRPYTPIEQEDIIYNGRRLAFDCEYRQVTSFWESMDWNSGQVPTSHLETDLPFEIVALKLNWASSDEELREAFGQWLKERRAVIKDKWPAAGFVYERLRDTRGGGSKVRQSQTNLHRLAAWRLNKRFGLSYTECSKLRQKAGHAIYTGKNKWSVAVTEMARLLSKVARQLKSKP